MKAERTGIGGTRVRLPIVGKKKTMDIGDLCMKESKDIDGPEEPFVSLKLAGAKCFNGPKSCNRKLVSRKNASAFIEIRVLREVELVDYGVIDLDVADNGRLVDMERREREELGLLWRHLQIGLGLVGCHTAAEGLEFWPTMLDDDT